VIVDKILGINQIDARLKPENNVGDGGNLYSNEQPQVHPQEIELYQKLMVEANA